MSRPLSCLAVCCLVVTACSSAPYAPATEGAACGELEATCSTDGSTLLVCEDDVFVADDACADGCTTAAASWFSSEVGEACCDNGAERVCLNIHNSDDRESFSFSD